MSERCSGKSELVDVARGWVRRLLAGEQRRSGIPVRQAAATVARRARMTPAAVMALAYEPPKDIGVSTFEALRAAVENEIKAEIEALTHELALARVRNPVARGNEIQEIEADLAALAQRLRVAP
jgi:hypothetical protein